VAHVHKYFKGALGFFIRAFGNHNVVKIADGGYTRIERDILGDKALGITGAVHFFVMIHHGFPYFFVEPAAAAQHFVGIDGVLFDDFIFFGGQFFG
jgi:6-phosphogluconate dehydrogenase (decarboxylating)